MGYMGLQWLLRVTGGYSGLQWITGGYWELCGVTGDYMRLLGVTSDYREIGYCGLQEVFVGYGRSLGIYRG